MPTEVDSGIILRSAPYIQYEQFQLDDNFRTYLETTLILERALRIGIKPNALPKIICDKHRCTTVRRQF